MQHDRQLSMEALWQLNAPGRALGPQGQGCYESVLQGISLHQQGIH